MSVTVRQARAIEAPILIAILQQRHEESRYAGKVAIVPDIARKLFAYAAQRHGGTNDGSTFLAVAEGPSRGIEGFVMGALSRVYMVGDMLAASDNFLIGWKDCDPRALDALLDAYIAWGDANPKVFEIGLSHADTIPGTERIIAKFERRGFVRFHQSFRREARGGAMEAA